MPNTEHLFLHAIKRVMQTLGGLVAFTIVFFLIVGAVAIWLLKGCGVQTDTHSKISLSPTQITKIRSIGQWEFLSVSDEELIDTIRHGFFGDDELSRIYYGTLRLGIDLSETEEDWIRTEGDTVMVVLPPVRLLDENFIDEARTKAFFEEGKWSESDKAQLARKAKWAMKARCLTPSNIRSAEQNASEQFSGMLHAMGFEFTKIRFRTDEKK